MDMVAVRLRCSNQGNRRRVKKLSLELSKELKSADDTAAAARRWLQVIQRYPISWFFIGIGLVFFAESSLKISIGSAGVSLLPPAAFPIKMLFRLLGFTIAILVLYLFFKSQFRAHKVLLAVCVTFWFATLVVLTWHYYTQSQDYLGMRSYGYDFVKRKFNVVIAGDALKRYSGGQIVFVVRKIDRKQDRQTDPGVAISKAFSIGNVTRDEPYEIDVAAIGDTLKIGDPLECFVITFPQNIDISSGKCVKDLIEKGGHYFLSEPVTLDVALEKLDQSYLKEAILQMPDDQRRKLISSFRE